MPGRNDPCFCGSGKKYKRCHLLLLQTAAASRSTLHKLDEAISALIFDFGHQRFGDEFRNLVGKLPSSLPFEEIQVFAVPFLLYQAPIGGRPVAAHFLEQKAATLAPRERAWIQHQLASWLTIWDVKAVDPGRGLSLIDRLTGQRREVGEVAASASLTPGGHILARVVDFDGSSVLCGTHPYPLPPREVEEIIASLPVNGKTIDALRIYDNAALLVTLWEQARRRQEIQLLTPPVLNNTDGDPFVAVSDHFRFDPRSRSDLERRIGKMREVHAVPSDSEAVRFDFVRAQDATLIGSVTVDDGSLRAETNSLRRADDLKQKLERATGNLLQYRGREISDPLRDFGKARDASPEESTPDPEADRITRELKERHYRSWLDQPIPALRGKTPREAVRSKRLRGDLELLLRDIEFKEGRLPPGQRFDVNTLYQALGIDRSGTPAPRKTSPRKQKQTQRIIDGVFDATGESPTLQNALADVDPAEARRYLAQRLRDQYQLGDGFVAQLIIDEIGVGGDLPRFGELMLDRAAPLGARAAALNIVSEDESLADSLVERLPQEEVQRLVNEPVRESLKMILVDADYAAGIVTLFADVEDGSDWRELFERVELLRREIGLPTSACYEWLLRAPWLPSAMRDEIMDSVTAEGGELGARLLEQLRDSTKDRDERNRLQAAITRIRTSNLDPSQAFHMPARGLLEPPDFRGQYFLSIVQQLPDEQFVLAQLVMQSGRLVAGAAGIVEDASTFDEKEVVQTEAGVVASLARHLLRNRVGDDEHDGETEAAIRLFQRVGFKTVPVPEPAAMVDREAFDALFARKEYEPWYFHDEELALGKILIPTVEPDERWYGSTIKKLNRSPIRRRLRAQSEFMSVWHFLRGEKEEAAMMGRIAADLEKKFVESVLVRALLERVVRLHRPLTREQLAKTSDDIVEAFESDRTDPAEMMGVLRRIVGNQLRLRTPPQVRQTLDRLMREGMKRNAARDLICLALHADLVEALTGGRTYDEAAYVKKLERLPKLPSPKK